MAQFDRKQETYLPARSPKQEMFRRTEKLCFFKQISRYFHKYLDR